MHRQVESLSECCSDAACDSGLRNNYFEGKRLTADAFRVEQDYLIDRRRLLNRAIHGPPGNNFSAATSKVSAAIQARFITPPTNKRIISSQQQPTQ